MRGLLGYVVRWNPQALPTINRLSGSGQLLFLGLWPGLFRPSI